MVLYEEEISEHVMSYVQFLDYNVKCLKSILKEIEELKYDFNDDVREHYKDLLNETQMKYNLTVFEILNECAPKYCGSDEHTAEFNFNNKTLVIKERKMHCGNGGCSCDK